MTEEVERVELWRRSEPAPPAREALADLTDRVERAAAAAGVELDRREWSAHLDTTARDPGAAASAYARFRRWAVREGVDLGPAFERETWRNEFSGEVGERVVLPVACLACYGPDGDIEAVYPHEDVTVRGVPEGIERLRRQSGTGRTGTRSTPSRDAGAPTVD